MRKRSLKLLWLLITMALLCSCSGKQGAGDAPLTSTYEGSLLPFESEDKWGYINPQGEVVIEPAYAYAGHFSNGLAIISDGDLYGYINEMNQVVIQPKYSGADEFMNGYAAVCTGNWQDGTALWGFINTRGVEIVKPQFLYVEGFSPEGRALVWTLKDDEPVNGFVDTKGVVFVPDQYEICSSFSDGLALIRQNGLLGYINTDYEIVIPPIYEFAGDFGEGVAYAEYDGNRYMIDKDGNVIETVKYAFAPFSHGLARFMEDDLYGYINKKGEVVIEPRFTWAKKFCNGLAAVQVRMEAGGKWGFINTQGELVIDAVYNEVEDFTKDYIRAYKYDNFKYYILDKTGRIIYSGQYSIE